MLLPSRPASLRLVASIALVAVVGCFVAAAGLFAACHTGEEPMSCCPDSGVPSTAGAQLNAAIPLLAAAFAELAAPSTLAIGVAPPPAARGSALGRNTYLRLSTLLI